ncbi:MAG TPA: hypothetical protein VHL77_07470, partial [Ferruginibacter sp.]|nr:hypothetical protein [Ferruginibacter sp.]
MVVPSLLKRFFFYGSFASIALLGSSCGSDDNDDNSTDVFWNEAKLNDFPLFEVAYLDIDII